MRDNNTDNPADVIAGSFQHLAVQSAKGFGE